MRSHNNSLLPISNSRIRPFEKGEAHVVQNMTKPYQAPHASLSTGIDDEHARRRRKFWLRAIWMSIAGVIIPPMFGLIGTVVGMVGAFGELSNTGTTDPESLAGNISIALLTTLWGLAISLIAFFVLIGVLIRLFTLPKLTGIPHKNSQAQQSAS
jgi:biopolymer transport protein ExbB/TolQ